MTQAQTKEIPSPEGPISVEITPSPFSVTRPALVRVTKTVGPSLATLADATRGVQGVDIAGGIQSFLEALQDEDLEYLAQAFGPRSVFSLDGKRVQVATAAQRDVVFTRLGIVAFLHWIVAVWEVNYADFFAALRDLRALGATARQTPG